METWFTSDFHLDHFNVIKYSDRPFGTVTEMNESIIDNVNKFVSKNDTLYFLGDFCFKNKNPIHYREKINCNNIVMILGNHDYRVKREVWEKLFLSVHDILVIHNPVLLTMCHYPLESWPSKSHKSICLHGHSHGKSRFEMNRIDVGVDCHNYEPINISNVVEIIKLRRDVLI